MATYIQIATVTVGAGGAANIDFSSIPSTYTDLCLKVSLRATNSSSARAEDALLLRLNNDSTVANYTGRWLRGNGTNATSGDSNTFAGAYIGEFNGFNSTANTFGSGTVYLPNYTSSTAKSISVDNVQEANQTTAYAQLHAGLYSGTSAINRLTLVNQNVNTFAQYSTATLYGISKS